MRTISIKEFKNLSTRGAPNRTEAFGRFALNERVQKKQCENLKVDDVVFFMEMEDRGIGEDGRSEINVAIVSATVIDDLSVEVLLAKLERIKKAVQPILEGSLEMPLLDLDKEPTVFFENLKLDEPKNAYHYGWETAMMECGEVIAAALQEEEIDCL